MNFVRNSLPGPYTIPAMITNIKNNNDKIKYPTIYENTSFLDLWM